MNSKLWGDFRVGFVFVVGIPISTESREFVYGNVRLTMSNRGWPFKGMEVNNTRLSGLKLLIDEAERHGDLLIGSFEDTYFNLTLKQMMAFRWAATFCRQKTDLFLFLDHDRALIPNNTIRFVRGISKNLRPDIVGGFVFRYSEVKRADGKNKIWKWVLSQDEFPFKHYPFYMGGYYGYIIGSELMRKLAITTAFTKYLRIEDAFVGIMLAKLGAITMNFNEFRHYRVDNITIRQVVTGPTDQVDKLVDWRTGNFKN